MSETSVVNVKKLKVAELKKELGLRGLKVTGNKGELQLRLEEYFKLQGLTVAEEDVVEEEEEEDEDGEEGEEAEEAEDGEDSLEEDSSNSNQDEEKIPEPKTVVDNNVPEKEEVTSEVPTKKQKLTETDTNGAQTVKEPTALNRKIKIATTPKVVSDVDKKLQRMKRFGGPTAEKDKMVERAKRFGTSPLITSATEKESVSNSDVEKLKQRAERFGAVSPAIVKLEDSEKIKKRKERFGMITTDVDARKKMRAERFNLQH